MLKVVFWLALAGPIITLLVLGCRTEDKSVHRVFAPEAPDVSLDAELAQVIKLCPVGTSAELAKARLGPSCHLVRYHGLVLNPAPGGDMTSSAREDWALEIEGQQGTILLWLAWPPGTDTSGLDRSSVYKIGRERVLRRTQVR